MTTRIPKKGGLVRDLDEATYHAHPTSLSVTGAKLLLKAPALYAWQREHPVFKDTFDFGKAAHREVLDAGCEIVVHEYDAAKVKSPKATNAWKAQQAEVRESGGVLLLPDEHQRLREMVTALRQHRLANRLLSNGEAEVSAFCVDESTGVLRRSRFDWVEGSRILVDYKTAVCSEPNAFLRSAVKFGYHMQARWYLDIAADLGMEPKAFAFVVQEREAPYLTTVVELPADLVDAGRERNRRALERYRDCVEAGLWPGYVPDDTFATPQAAPWMLRDSEYALDDEREDLIA